jgi:serine/threonine-protein kinase
MLDAGDALTGVFAGRYVVDREVGRGASSVVYRAVDQQTGQLVAVKVLREGVQGSMGGLSFLREVRHAQRLDHPRIVPILDSGTHQGLLFVVLPYLPGGTLRDRLLRERQLQYLEAIRITQAIADALGHAHQAGVLHRDVKPENVLFGEHGPSLSDLGISRALEPVTDESTTSTGVVRGTPAYMSPEQAAGQTQYDGRSDLYSLACVLYEMVTGMPPFTGPTAQSVMAQRLTVRPVPMRQYRDGVPEALELVVQRALMITPADRYKTAQAFSEALERVVEDALVGSGGNRAVAPMRKRRVVGLVVGALAIASALALAVQWSRLDPLPATDTVDPRRIAVLFLEDLTPDVLPSHVTDGLTEDLIDRLGSVRGLHVISPNGVRPFRDGVLGFDSIGRLLNVGTVVEGKAARSGNLLRITVRLVDPHDGVVLESRTIQQPWTELFTMQDSLTEQVQFWLRRRLGEEVAVRANRAATRSVAAWEAVQVASQETQRAVTAATLRGDTSSIALFLRADSQYVRASEFDPGWAYPLVRRANLALLAMAVRSPIPPRFSESASYRSMTALERRALWTNRAIELTQAALRVEPDNASALAVRGQARAALAAMGSPGRDSLMLHAEEDLREAVARRPDLASAWTARAEVALLRGQFAAAAGFADQAYDADAFYEVRRVMDVGFTAALYAEQFDVAERWCRRGLTHYAGDPRFTECELRLLGATGRTSSDVGQAWQLVARIEARDTLGLLQPTWGFRRLMAAAVLARSGARDSARAVLSSVLDEQPAIATRPSEAAVCFVLTLLGDRQEAIRRLTELLRQGQSTGAPPLALFPWFHSLRGDPQFDRLVPAR